MINIIPVILLNTLSSNTNNNGYSYKTTYELTFNVNYLNISEGTSPNFDYYCNEGRIWIEGTAYINNVNSYRFTVDDFGFNMIYYHNSTDLGFFTSSSTNDTYGFYFDERDSNLSFRTGVGYGDSSGTIASASILNTGTNTIYCDELIDSDYFDDYVDYSSISGMYISNDWVIDFRNDSTWIDCFELTLQNAIRATELPMNEAYNNGYTDGFQDGYIEGKGDGIIEGRAEGKAEGLAEGYANGYRDGESMDETAAAIYAGIIATGMIPIQFFLTIFNFEIFGINLTGLVTSLMSICIVLIVIKRTFAIHEDS